MKIFIDSAGLSESREADASAFDDLLGRLRETEEWTYVEREVEIRLRLPQR